MLNIIINTNVVFLQKVGIQQVRQSLDQVQLGWIEIQTEYDNAISNQMFDLEISCFMTVGELLVKTFKIWMRSNIETFFNNFAAADIYFLMKSSALCSIF